MNGNVHIVAIGVALVAVVAAPAAGAWGTGVQPGQAQQATDDAMPSFVTVQTAVEPSQPTPGDPFEVVTTLANGEDADVGYSVPELHVRGGRDDDSETYASLTNLDHLDPGEALSVSPSVELNETGRHTLYVHARLVGPDGDTNHVVAPVRVRVYRPAPLLAVEAAPADPGEGRTLSVTVANGRTEPIREVEVRLAGESVTLDQDRRVAAQVPPGGARTLSFDAESDSLGTKRLEATLSYTTADGTRRTTTETLRPTFEGADDEGEDDTDGTANVTGSIELAADAATAVPGARRTMNVTLVNGLSVPVRQYDVRIDAGELTVDQPRRIGGVLPTGERRRLQFAVEADSPGTYEVEATVDYTTDNGTERTVTRRLPVTVAAPTNPGNLTLTGLDFSRGPGGLQISGTVANRGGTAVSGAVVAVADGADAGPAAAQSEYFVGTVGASDFVSFDVNARLQSEGSAATIPLRVEYVVDGVVRQRTVTVTYSPGAAGPSRGPSGSMAGGPGSAPGSGSGPEGGPAPQQSSGGGLPLVPIAVGLVALVAVVYGGRRLLAWRG